MAQNKSFIDDVKKELECSVCQEQFSEINEPKILKCLHTYCKTCLEAWLRHQREGRLSCPTCRQITECPNNNINSLPSNLFYKQMLEIVETYSGQRQEDSQHCGNCDERKSLKFYCSDCNSFLCDDCAGAHKKWKIFRGHHVKEIGSFESADVQDYARRANFCKKHKDELRFYCEKCQICICRDCAILEHQDHNKISLDQGLEKNKCEIETKMRDVQASGSRLRNNKDSLEKSRLKLSSSIEEATKEVKRVAERCILLIRQHEASVTERLVEQKAAFEDAFATQISGLNGKLMEIDSTLEFSKEVLLRDNLPEILNVKAIIEQRLQELSVPFEFIPRQNQCSGVKYVPNDVSFLKDVPGRLVTTNTKPIMSVAKGLTDGFVGEDCTFTVITKNLAGQTTYSEIDEVSVKIISKRQDVLKTVMTDLKDGRYSVSYRPTTPGELAVSICVAGNSIMGSPFRVKVKNRSKFQSMADDKPDNRDTPTKQAVQTVLFGGDASIAAQQRMEMVDAGKVSIETYRYCMENGVNISLRYGDITNENVDAIVNPANDLLAHGAGLAKFIVRTGGREIQMESDKLMIEKRRGKRLNLGEAVHTKAGNLPCKYVIHAVVPEWEKLSERETISLLQKACVESLKLATKLGLSTIALPVISSGVFRIPNDVCAFAMLNGVEEYLENLKKPDVSKKEDGDGKKVDRNKQVTWNESRSKESSAQGTGSGEDQLGAGLRDIRFVLIDADAMVVFEREFVKRFS